MNWKKKYYLDIGIAVFIAVLPFCMYAYLLIDKTITEFTFLGKVYLPQAGTVQLGVYFVTARLIPFLLFSMWFISSRQKFTYFVLVPAFYNFHKANMYFIFLFGDSPQHFDNYEESYLEGFLFFTPILLLLIYLRRIHKIYKVGDEKTYFTNENVLLTFLNKKKKYRIHKRAISSVNLFKSEDKKHLQNLFYSKQVLDKDKDLLKQDTKTKNWFEIVSVILFLSTPILYNIFRYVPEDYVFYFYPMSEPNGRCISFSAFVYYMIMKWVPIISLTFWYITSNNWFRTVILIPLIIYTYQVHEILFGNSGKIDEVEYLQSLPLVLIVLLLTYIVSVIYKYDLKSYSIRKQLDQEIDRLINKFAKRNSEL